VSGTGKSKACEPRRAQFPLDMGRKVTANLFPWTGGSQSQSPAPASNVRISDFSSLMGRAAKGPNQRLSVGDALRLTPYFGRRRLLQDAAPNVEALRGGKSEPGRRFNLAQAKNTMSFDHASVKIRVSKPQSPIVREGRICRENRQGQDKHGPRQYEHASYGSDDGLAPPLACKAQPKANPTQRVKIPRHNTSIIPSQQNNQLSEPDKGSMSPAFNIARSRTARRSPAKRTCPLQCERLAFEDFWHLSKEWCQQRVKGAAATFFCEELAATPATQSFKIRCAEYA